jgi:acyl dehydratase
MPPRVIEGSAALKALVGQEVGVSDWLVVPQSLIDSFAELTGDHQWIHCDPERARAESPYGATVAHGFLTLSLLSRLLSQTIQVRGGFSRSINYGLNRLRFPAPVLAGARIRARCVLQQVEDVTGGIQITWGVTVEHEDQPKPALVVEWLNRFYL